MASQILTTEELMDMLHRRAEKAVSAAEVVVILEGLEEIANEIRGNEVLPLKGQIYAEIAADAIGNATAQIPYQVRAAL